MDLNKAILYAQLVGEAYRPNPGDLKNREGDVVSAGLGTAQTQFDVITTIYANDLATQANPGRDACQVSIGLILQARDSGEAVIAFRGTEGIKEWVLDANFGTIPCPFLASAGETEDGFTHMYESVATGTAVGAPKLVESLPGLRWKAPPIEMMTVCGHSLGGALATLATLDIAVNAREPYHNVSSYTFASPRTGNVQFASKYDQLVANTYRVANELDVVPRLPLFPPFPPYQHVMGEFDLKPYTVLPPKFLLQPNPYCEHILTSYLFLLSHCAGGQILPLEALCGPLLSFSALMSDVEAKWSDIGALKREFAATDGLV
jgi:hypothetical protein